MSKTIRFVSILGLAAIAAVSQAVSFNFTGSSNGVVLSGNGSGNFTSNGTTIASPPPFMLLNVAQVTQNGAGNSTAVFSSTTNPAVGTFTVNFSGIPDNSQAGQTSLSAVATSFSGTGSFTGFNTGSLNVTSNTNTTSQTNLFTVTGNVNTPEPTSFAALGVGALALLRRRRKA